MPRSAIPARRLAIPLLVTGGALVALLGPAAPGSGAAPAPKPAKDAAAAAPVWPAPPDTARIAWVASLRGSSDLGRRGSAWSRLRRAATGAAAERAIELVRPTDVYAPDSTRLYVSDASIGQVLVFDLAARDVRPLATDGPGSLGKPMGLCGDGAGRLYVADAAGRRVVALALDGTFVRAYGGRELLLNPVDVAVDPARGRVYVADSYLHQVVVFDSAGALVRRIGLDAGDLAGKLAALPAGPDSSSEALDEVHRAHAGARDLRENRGGGPGEFLYPVGVALGRGGDLYVCDGLNARIQQFDPAGAFVREFGGLGDRPGTFARPKAVALDPDGHVYVVDAAFNNVQIFDAEGRLLLDFGRLGTGPGELWLPMGLSIDAHGRIYVADRYNGRVQIFRYLAPPPAAAVPEPSGSGR